MSPQPEMRISDAERDAAANALGEHYAAGRLTNEEYDERSDTAFAAKTSSDLRPLFVDLPPLGGRSPLGGRPSHPRAQTTGLPSRTPFGPRLPLVAVLGILLVLVTVFSGAPWLLFVFGWMFFCGPWHRGWPHGR